MQMAIGTNVVHQTIYLSVKNLLLYIIYIVCDFKSRINKLTCFKLKPNTNLKYVGAWRDIVYIPQL